MAIKLDSRGWTDGRNSTAPVVEVLRFLCISYAYAGGFAKARLVCCSSLAHVQAAIASVCLLMFDVYMVVVVSCRGIWVKVFVPRKRVLFRYVMIIV